MRNEFPDCVLHNRFVELQKSVQHLRIFIRWNTSINKNPKEYEEKRQCHILP